jgi:hypothetical protein
MGLPEYFIGAGDIFVAFLDESGNPTTWRDVGECPSIEYTQNAEFVDNFATGKEGPNLQDLHVLIRRTGAMTLQLKERTAENLALILHGTATTDPAGAYAQPFNLPPGIQDGDIILLPSTHAGITNLVLHDSAGTPATLDETNYTFDGDTKLITFLSVTTLVQPIQVISYDYGESSSVLIATETPPDCAVIFDGINLAVPNEKVWARFDRVAFSPAATVSLKSGGAGGTANEVAMYELTGVVQLKPGNTQADGYGEMRTY